MIKKLIKKAIAFALVLVTLASLVSCGEEAEKLSVGGLDFALPEYMGKLISDGYGAYANEEDGTKVLIYYYPASQIAEELSEGLSIVGFAEHYASKNNIQPISSKYDGKSDTYTMKYIETVDGEELFSHDYFLRSDNVYYHFRMTCKKALRGEYEKKFDKWKKSVEISEELISYSECGLNFALPDYMKKINVPTTYADICFSNRGDGTEFFIYYYSRESLLVDLSLNMDSTVKEYVDWHEEANGYVYDNIEEEYDEENQKIVQRYFYEPENTFYFNVVMRDKYSLVHVTMSCDNKNREVYEPIFERWMQEFSLAS